MAGSRVDRNGGAGAGVLPSTIMSASLREPMTKQAFLAWEEGQELKWEYDGFGPVAMTGVSIAHATIHGNAITALNTRLRGGPCRAYGSDLKIEAGDNSVRYPDVLVSRTRQPGTDRIAAEPVVVFEILSPTTSRTDRIIKAREYGATPSIQRYVILEQSAQAATVFTHMLGVWASIVLDGDAVLDMPEIGISVPLAELYQDVELDAA